MHELAMLLHNDRSSGVVSQLYEIILFTMSRDILFTMSRDILFTMSRYLYSF